MRKFDHWKILKIAFNIIYVVSFITLVSFAFSVAKESRIEYKVVEQESIDCMNCDEID